MNWDPTPDNGLKDNGKRVPSTGNGPKDDPKETCHSVRERRMGIDRRNFSYTHHVPERRRGRERRAGSNIPCRSDS